MKKFLFCTIHLFVFCFLGLSNETPEVRVYKTTEPIQLDGALTESAWQSAEPAKNFWQYFPNDSVAAINDTEIYFLFDDKHIYVGVKCFTNGPDLIVQSLRRDFRAGGNDNITLLFDPFNDGANAFFFGMNPLGVRREGLISDGGNSNNAFTTTWDNKWEGTATIHDGYWICEMAIPFKTLRYNEASTKWRFNCYRFETQINERTTWVRIPRNQSIFNLAFMGNMIWEEAPRPPSRNISVIPFATGSWFEDTEDPDAKDTETDMSFGGDAKVAISSGLNLDLTVNPDFSQVEVDQQVTNLSRFEIFFPERRQFFIENADLFGSFGTSRINPFFSRRIGIAYDSIADLNIQNKIWGGARLSGKLNDHWRIGMLNMVTQKNASLDLPTFNYSVAALQRKMFARSNIGLIFVNRQAIDGINTEFFDRYNRVIGLDYNLASFDNKWSGKAFLHKAFVIDRTKDTWAHGLNLEYRVRKIRFEWRHDYVGENFDAQVGFVPRTGILRINPIATYFIYPRRTALNQVEIELENEMFFKPGIGLSDQQWRFNIDLDWQDNSRFGINFFHDYTYLFDTFDPTNTDALPLPSETEYGYYSLSLFYGSDTRRLFSYRIRPRIGQYFNGFRAGIEGSFTYRFQPFGSIRINYNLNYIELPKPYATTTLLLIGPRLDVTFSQSVFLTTFVQFNNQNDNLNINMRFQWRFKPVSDFFLVYTNNYFTDRFRSRNRSLVAKVTYWLNL